MFISQGSLIVSKNHNVILLILLTLLDKLATLLNLLKNQQLLKISPGLEPRCAMCTLRLYTIVTYVFHTNVLAYEPPKMRAHWLLRATCAALKRGYPCVSRKSFMCRFANKLQMQMHCAALQVFIMQAFNSEFNAYEIKMINKQSYCNTVKPVKLNNV